MFWIVQSNLFREENYEQMIEALTRLQVPHTIAKVLPFVDELEPEPVVPEGSSVFVCGSTKLMRMAETRRWSPGSFMNANMTYEMWNKHMGRHLLNPDAVVGPLDAINFPEPGEFFIRPCADGKAFSGRCFYRAEFEKWREHMINSEGIIVNAKFERHKLGCQPDTLVMISPYRHIQREYRFFVVDQQVITGSLYKIGGRAATDPQVDPDVWAFTQRMVDQWIPSRAFVIDVAMTEEGLKIVEYNCINCSGFYACDTAKIVGAIESMGF